MKFLSQSPNFFLFIIALFLIGAFFSSLSGCSVTKGNRLSEAIESIGGSGKLSKEAEIEFDRFKKVFNKNINGSNGQYLEYFSYAFKRLRASYFRKISDTVLIDAAIKGVNDSVKKEVRTDPEELIEAALDSMTASLDPHTSYLNREEFKESFIQTRGEFGGLGIEVTIKEGFVKVVSPIEGTPAFRAGLISGDLITHVDSALIKGKTLREAVRLMRGAPGTEIILKIKRRGVTPFDVSMIRALIKVKAVRWDLTGKVAYIRVSRFSERLDYGLNKAIEDVKTSLGGLPKGIILDLRNNPGGLLKQSIILADNFLKRGEIVSIRGRNPKAIRSFKAKGGDIGMGVPMVVLINNGSASASEIVASALKYNGRATILGTRSYGKGSVQTIIPLLEVGALKVTTALYYGPDGRTIQAQGVSPNIRLYSKDNVEISKESDLPGAIVAQNAQEANSSQIKIPEGECLEHGEFKDRILGCAIEFLEYGKESFLRRHTKL